MKNTVKAAARWLFGFAGHALVMGGHFLIFAMLTSSGDLVPRLILLGCGLCVSLVGWFVIDRSDAAFTTTLRFSKAEFRKTDTGFIVTGGRQ